jgi:hypothetical protein
MKMLKMHLRSYQPPGFHPDSPSDQRDGDAADQAFSRCRNIETTAGLLAASGQQEGAQPLEVDLVAHAGWMINFEARRLRALMESNRYETRLRPDGWRVVRQG